jgi:hypothetical protein
MSSIFNQMNDDGFTVMAKKKVIQASKPVQKSQRQEFIESCAQKDQVTPDHIFTCKICKQAGKMTGPEVDHLTGIIENFRLPTMHKECKQSQVKTFVVPKVPVVDQQNFPVLPAKAPAIPPAPSVEVLAKALASPAKETLPEKSKELLELEQMAESLAKKLEMKRREVSAIAAAKAEIAKLQEALKEFEVVQAPVTKDQVTKAPSTGDGWDSA